MVATGSSVGSGAPPVGGAVTVTLALPLFPSLVAVIVAEPAATPVTSPLDAFTDAIEALLLDHITFRPVSVFPLASLSVALNGCVWLMEMVAAAGVTATVATGTRITVMPADP